MPDEARPPIERVIAVLDVVGHGGRSLAETVRGADLAAVEVASLEELETLLCQRRIPVCLLAFEAIWDRAEKTLRGLRAATEARLIVSYPDGSPRQRLAQRLWTAGLIDWLAPRSAAPHELGPTLRQAYADAVLDQASAAADAGGLAAHVTHLRHLVAGFTGQRTIEGLMRELQLKLPQLVDHSLVEVLVIEGDSFKLFVCPNTPVEHQQVWSLAQEACAATTPFLDRALSPSQLTFLEIANVVAQEGGADPRVDAAGLAIPMVLRGELVGAFCVLLPRARAEDADTHALLHLVACQLATAIRTVQALDSAENASLIDELTHALNRRALDRLLADEWRRTARYRLRLGVAMIDLDHFKRVNDAHGHLAGDRVLRSFAELLQGNLRSSDHLVRYGGEEFLLVMPATDASEAMIVLDRLRLLLARTVFETGAASVGVTFSAGIASFPDCDVATPELLVGRADHALLEAKRAGRDCVRVARDLGAPAGAEAGRADRRQSERLPTSLPVSFIELPNFEPQHATIEATDLSVGGVGVQGLAAPRTTSTYGLVYLEGEPRPRLAQVAWVRDMGDGKRAAGLRYVKPTELRGVGEPARTGRLRALVVARRPKTRAVVERVLRAAAYEVDVVEETPESAAPPPDLAAYGLVVIGESVFRGALGERLQQLRSDSSARLKVVVLNEESDRRQALDTVARERVEHLVPGSPSSEETLFATLSKILLAQYFGIKKYLHWGAETLSWTMRSAAEKPTVLDGIRQLAADVRCHPRILDSLLAAVDEMIVNALRASQQTAGPSPVVVQCGTDGRLLAVSVLDELGLFQPQDLFAAVGTALRAEEGEPSADDRPHLGFRIMLSTLSQLAINVDPGRCTEIIGIVDLRQSLREYRASVPSIGLFQKT